MSITMTTVILFAVFGVLLFLGVPISISIVASSIVTAMSTLSWDQITFITMQKMNSGVESFSLLAVPLFILAGNIMNNGGIAKRLVNFAQLFVGKIPGSMAQANILGNMLFGALSGSSVAAAFFSESFRVKLWDMIFTLAFFLRLSEPFFNGLSLQLVIFVLSLHI